MALKLDCFVTLFWGIRLLYKKKHNKNIIKFKQAFHPNFVHSYKIRFTDNSNKIIESLGNEFRTTLENFKIDGNGNLNSKLIKYDTRNTEIDYSKEIKKISENLINNMGRSQNMNKTTRKVPA